MSREKSGTGAGRQLSSQKDSPAAGLRTFAGRLMPECGLGCAQHDTRPLARAFLHNDSGGIHLTVLDLGEWHTQGLIDAGKLTELAPRTHNIVIDECVTAVLAAADNDRDGARDGAQPDLALGLLAG